MWTTIAVGFGIIIAVAVFVTLHFMCIGMNDNEFDSEYAKSLCTVDGFGVIALIAIGAVLNNFLVGIGLFLIIPFVLTVASYFCDRGIYWVLKEYLEGSKTKKEDKEE